jgi:hypothetical protein
MKHIMKPLILSFFAFVAFHAKAEVTAYEAARLIQESKHIGDDLIGDNKIEDFSLVKNVVLNHKMSFLVWTRPSGKTKNDLLITVKTPIAYDYQSLTHDAYFVLPQDAALEAIRAQGRTYNEQFGVSYPFLVGGELQKYAANIASAAVSAKEMLKRGYSSIFGSSSSSSSSSIRKEDFDVVAGKLDQTFDQIEGMPTFIHEEIDPIDDALGELLRNIGYFFTPHILKIETIKDTDHFNIYFAGHGFGGVIAQYLANKYKKSGFSFASMGLGQFKKYLQGGMAAKRNEDEYAAQSFVNYIRDKDEYGNLNLDYYGRIEMITGLPLSEVQDFNRKLENVRQLYTTSRLGALSKPYLEARYGLMIEYLVANHDIDGYVSYLDTIFNAELRESARRFRDSLLSDVKEAVHALEVTFTDIGKDVEKGWGTFKKGVANFFNKKNWE